MIISRPDVKPGDWLTVTQAAAALQVSRKTIMRYLDKSKWHGGIEFRMTREGRRKISGKEIIRFWETH